MAVNIEFKAYYDDPIKAESLGRQYFELDSIEVYQQDTYFNAPRGQLKIRECSVNGNYIIYYKRMASPLVRESNFQKISINSDSKVILFKSLFNNLLGDKIVVKKNRKTFNKDNILMHIDSVEQLGHFVEIEVELVNDNQSNEGQTKANYLRTILGIPMGDIVPWSYSDLLIMQNAAYIWRENINAVKNIGKLFIIDGASCTGKTTMSEKLLNDPELKLHRVARYSTRAPRENSASEKEYIFISSDEFNRLASDGAFLEYRDFEFGMSYGLPWHLVYETLCTKKTNGLGVINLGNVRHVKTLYPECCTILITASEDTIRKRLIMRGYNKDVEIEERLNNAKLVRDYTKYYDYVIENEDGLFDKAFNKIREIILSY